MRAAIFLALVTIIVFLCQASRDPYSAYLARRIEVIRANIVNADTAADAQSRNVPYRRQVAEWDAAHKRAVVRDDPSPFPRVRDPGHPLAAADSYYLRTNVDLTSEKVDLRLAEQAFSRTWW